MKKAEIYKGREQSGIKHYLLENYLETLFMILGQIEPRICYIDCFAGPWKESDEGLSGTSIALSLNVMRKCRSSLYEMGKTVEFRALFVEKEKLPYKKLDAYLKENQSDGITTKALNGEFYALQGEILQWCGPQDFAFFFIDPKGWKNAIEVPTLTPLLQRCRSEYLINFMYDFLLRTHTQLPFKEDMKAIFGEVPETSEMNPKQRERNLIQRYRDSLKSIPANNTSRLRSAYVTILDRVKERTKYHLVYLTRHPLGIIKFMGVSEKMEQVQKRVRAKTKQQLRIEKSGQTEFSFVEIKTVAKEVDEMDVVKDYWLERLSLMPKRFGNEALANMLEDTNWFESDLQQAFNELIVENKVANLDMRAKRPKKPVHFQDNERLQRTKL